MAANSPARRRCSRTRRWTGSVRCLGGAAYESPLAADTDYADGRVAAETIQRLKAAKQRLAKRGTPFFITAGFVRPHLPFSAPKRYWDIHDPVKLPMPVYTALPKGAPRVALKRGGEIAAYLLSRSTVKSTPHSRADSSPATTRAPVTWTRRLARSPARLANWACRQHDCCLVGGPRLALGRLGIWTKQPTTSRPIASRSSGGPGLAKPGSVTRQLAETVDLFPTLAELAGLPAPRGPQPIDGVSLVPGAGGSLGARRDHAFHAYPRRGKLGRAIRTQRYRLVEWKNHSDPTAEVDYELYDYQADPQETQNHYAAKPGVAVKLKAILARYAVPTSRSRR
ncbi:MAG: hypothetical protein CM1200mP29_14630 [Verrucomicrobiota bacterium]|nr:MAG: hypothetical protein CM1200mP29_14630 [Verrucomicrobiota bacterium]